jgi:hypothetical protein
MTVSIDLGRSDPVLQGEDGLIDHRTQDAVRDEAGRVLGLDGFLPIRRPTQGGLRCRAGGRQTRTSSSNRIRGTGLKKCIPMT